MRWLLGAAPAERVHISGLAPKRLSTQRSSSTRSAGVTQHGPPTTNVLIAARGGYSITRVHRRTDRLPYLVSEHFGEAARDIRMALSGVAVILPDNIAAKDSCCHA